MKKTLAILFGGVSSEHDVSLHSAAAVIRAVDTNQYHLVQVGITRSGQWLFYPGGADAIEQDAWWQHPGCLPAVLSPSREDSGLWLMGPDSSELCRLDVVFPVLHGQHGEDGTLQGLLELAGIPFVGCGCASSALCMDKETAHNLALQAGIPSPKFVTLYADDGGLEAAVQAARAGMAGVAFPWFVKPAAAGSSFGVSRVENADALPAALVTAFRYGPKVVVEEGISGFEVGCAVMGDASPVTGAVDAIALAGGFFDFHEKYTLETAKILLPAPIDDAVAQCVKATALRLYRLFGCKGLARVDLFLTGDGALVFNEVNTIPGMTPHSRYPGMMRQAGMPFDEMINRLIEEATPA